LTLTVSDPVGQDVQTPPCFAQNEQVHARAGISDGSGRQSSANEILPQWQRPEINISSAVVSITLKSLNEFLRCVLEQIRPPMSLMGPKRTSVRF